MKIALGEVDGEAWEKLVHKCFKIKYPNTYTEIPAKFGGDLGIESFNEDKVYQCFCPDGNPNSKELYESQRNKITTDLRKLEENETELLKLMTNEKIRIWYFTTPKYENKALLAHCRKKEKEVRGKNCKHISSDFRVHILDEEHFTLEFKQLVGVSNYKYHKEIEEITEQMIEEWKENQSTFYNNIERKIKKLGISEKEVPDFIERNIKSLIKGEMILNDLGNNYPEMYREIRMLVESLEDDIRDKSALKLVGAKNHFSNTSKEFEKKLNDRFKDLISSEVSNSIKRHTVSLWLSNCPLNF